MTTKQRLVEAFKNFRKATLELNEALECDYNPIGAYPFPQCFEELTLEVIDWVDIHVKVLDSGEFVVPELPTLEERLSKCQDPGCGSTNIQIVEGPLGHYIAKRSGLCDNCGCVWKVD